MFRLTFIFLFIINYSLYSVVFSVYNFKSENFPQMTAEFLLLDDDGFPIDNISDTNFRVIDNYNDVSNTIEVNCFKQNDYAPQKIALVLDISSSMLSSDSSTNETVWSWVKEGVTSFLNTIKFENNIEVGLIVFNHKTYIISNFTNNRDYLIQSLNKIEINGGTNYDDTFLDLNNGIIGLFKDIPDKFKKICIFLTDGYPNDPPSTVKIVEGLLTHHIQVFSLTVKSNMNYSLKEISNNTGGVSFEIQDKTTLNHISDLIAIYTSSTQKCELKWTSNIDCNIYSNKRLFEITYLPENLKRYFYYEAPNIQTAQLLPDNNYINLEKVSYGQDTTFEITLTAINSFFRIDSIIIQGNNNINLINTLSYPINIEKNDFFKFKVHYKNYKINIIEDANITILSYPCMTNINIITGNYTLELQEPNGGEIFTVCDIIPIEWGKCKQEDNIDIFFKNNLINDWQIIANAQDNFNYNWNLNYESLMYDDNESIIKIKLSDTLHNLWLEHIGDSNNQFITDYTFLPYSPNLFVIGNFENEIDFKNHKFSSRGNLDGFIAKYDKYGNLLKAAQIGSPKLDSLSAIFYDKYDDFIYLTGFCHNELMFNDSIFTNSLSNYQSFIFIIKLTPDLELKDYIIGPKEIVNDFRNVHFKVYDINISNQYIYLYGKFKGRLSIYDETYINDTSWTDFEAAFDKRLDLFFFRPYHLPDSLNNDFSYTDINNVNYKFINLKDSLIINDSVYYSKGQNDIIIYKSYKHKAIEDTSDSFFKVIEPNYLQNYDTLNLGNITAGEKKELTFYNVLKDLDIIPLEIKSIEIEGTDSNYFYYNDVSSKTIDFNDSLSLTIGCYTDDFRTYEAILKVDFECAVTAYFRLIANAECNTEFLDSIFVTSTPINFQYQTTIHNIFTNKNNLPLTLEPIIINDSLNEFKLSLKSPIILQPYQSLDADILFTPKTIGFKKVQIDWQPNIECEQSSTLLTAIGLDTKISVPSIDWKLRRVGSVNDTVVYLTNNNNFSVKIDSLKLPDNEIFKLKYDISNKYIKSFDSIGVVISFIPQQEINYNSAIEIYINSINKPFIIDLKGEGGLPQINVSYKCKDETLVNKTNFIDLVLENISTKMPVNIYSLKLHPKDSAFKITDSNLIQIPISSKEYIMLEFTPHNEGSNSDTLVIISNACPQKYPNTLDTIFYNISCEAFDFNINDKIGFNTISTCQADTQKILIKNTAKYTDLIIFDYKINYFQENFTVLNKFPITIKPMDSVEIKIKFESNQAGNYITNLIFNTNLDTIISSELNAISLKFTIRPRYLNYIFDIGIDTLIAFDFNFPDINIVNLNELDIFLHYNFNSIIFNLDNISSNLSNWDWQVESIDNNNLHLKGKGIINQRNISNFLNLPISTILGDSIGFLTLRYGTDKCILDDSNTIAISLSNICFKQGRRVILSNNKDIVSFSPNPFNEILNLKLKIPLNNYYKIKITDILGRLYYYEKINNTESYIIKKIDLKDLQPGLYFLIIELENETIIEKIIKLYE